MCHCGETFNPWTEEELAYILETLRPKRLGHGIQLHRFPALMKIASAQGTELEICISSNFATRVVRTKREFRQVLRRLEECHVPFSFHTDATFLLNTDISLEHLLAQEIRES